MLASRSSPSKRCSASSSSAFHPRPPPLPLLAPVRVSLHPQRPAPLPRGGNSPVSTPALQTEEQSVASHQRGWICLRNHSSLQFVTLFGAKCFNVQIFKSPCKQRRHFKAAPDLERFPLPTNLLPSLLTTPAILFYSKWPVMDQPCDTAGCAKAAPTAPLPAPALSQALWS